MLSLTEATLGMRFLGCGDGPASFNREMTRRGGHVVSVDPLYRFDAKQIRHRIDVTYDEVMEQTRKNKDEFMWNHIASVERLGEIRMAAMRDFLADFTAGLGQGRYIDAGLPDLPFDDGEFDIALCSHFLFLYSERLSEDFHVQSISEMCRVATEARIFPVLELGAIRSRHLENAMDRLVNQGFNVEVETVPYEFQKRDNEMLKVAARR